jgi:membrane fusion protein (multidrug efflux system)
VSAATDISNENAPVAPEGKAGSKCPILAALLLGFLALGGWKYAATIGHERTDDAQVEGDIVGLAVRTSGAVKEVRFADNTHIAAGDVLVVLDDDIQKAKLAQAEASLEVAKAQAEAAEKSAALSDRNARGTKTATRAQLDGAAYGATQTKEQIAASEARVTAARSTLAQAKEEEGRAKRLFDTGSVSKAQFDLAKTALDNAQSGYDQSVANLESARANVGSAQSRVAETAAKLEQVSDVDTLVAEAAARSRTAKAQVLVAQASRDLAALDLSFTKIVAPQAGVVTKKSVGVGQLLAPGSTIAQLVPDGSLWIVANFKETQIGAMRTGNPVEIEVDALPGRKFQATVESFSPATGSRFSLLPPDNASGNYTKVVQRIPVRMKIENLGDALLRPGFSVTANVKVR